MPPDRTRLLLATKNRGKAEELAALITRIPVPGRSLESLDLADWEAGREPLPEPLEGESGFVENARLKAVYYAQTSGLPALADDSGLSVVALGGQPGVLSARYGGPGLDDAGRCLFLLEKLGPAPDRRAFFSSVLALARPDGAAIHWEGRLEGLITREMKGAGGFGYDPIFYHPPSGRTLAELSPAEKNAISHRARAARALLGDSVRLAAFLDSNE